MLFSIFASVLVIHSLLLPTSLKYLEYLGQVGKPMLQPGTVDPRLLKPLKAYGGEFD